MRWDPEVRLVIADVDDTLAEPYLPIEAEMRDELAALLAAGTKLLLASGAGIGAIDARVVSRLPSHLRREVLVAHCNGAEVYGYGPAGGRLPDPLHSVVTASQRAQLRAALHVAELAVKELELEECERPPAPPGCVVVDDRGVQLSLDLGSRRERDALLDRIRELLDGGGLAVEARPGGDLAVDIVLPHVDKGRAVQAVLGCHLAGTGRAEVWGDQFSVSGRGADVPMALAVPGGTRVISFRDGPAPDLPPVPGMRAWPGPAFLHRGVLDHLKGRTR
ncbi:hypothetical protein ACIBH1_22650 [Nonomuraea sp. NPDC050663]|uniref:hypothetical protein n=1 Tax=Nonomuraea sp. NPDC050663 TaxID=3364370 RepID=UPI0037A8C243